MKGNRLFIASLCDRTARKKTWKLKGNCLYVVGMVPFSDKKPRRRAWKMGMSRMVINAYQRLGQPALLTEPRACEKREKSSQKSERKEREKVRENE